MIGSQDVCSGFFVTQRFVTQASQSSWDRRAELDVFLATPSAQSACGMEDFMKVVDMHCDTIAALYENKEKGWTLQDNKLHIRLDKMKQGDYLLQNLHCSSVQKIVKIHISRR